MGDGRPASGEMLCARTTLREGSCLRAIVDAVQRAFRSFQLHGPCAQRSTMDMGSLMLDGGGCAQRCAEHTQRAKRRVK
jgi:hypothetical protein